VRNIGIYILLFCIGLGSAQAQQDPLYTQYMFNPLNYNPAYAGSRSILSAALIYRKQWVGVDGAPTVTAFSAHSPLKNKNMGVGFEVTSDEIGPTSNIWIKGSYAYRIKINKIHKGRIGFGLKAGVFSSQYNWDKINLKDTDDGQVGVSAERYTVPTFDFGVYYSNPNKYFAGISITNIGSPSLHLDYDVNVDNYGYTSQARLYSSIILTYGHVLEINDRVLFRPSFLARTGLDFNPVVDVNLSLLFDAAFWLGVSYRTSNTVALVLEYEISRMFKLGYSYDYDLNPLATGFSGSQEIFLGFNYNVFRSRMRSPRYYF
jgi:type IX secretion system PorP/SprF family membrane protein